MKIPVKCLDRLNYHLENYILNKNYTKKYLKRQRLEIIDGRVYNVKWIGL